MQAIWARRLPAGKGPSNARKRALTHDRHEATGSEKPPKIPHYIPPWMPTGAFRKSILSVGR